MMTWNADFLFINENVVHFNRFKKYSEKLFTNHGISGNIITNKKIV